MIEKTFSSPYIQNEEQERIYRASKKRLNSAVKRADAKRERRAQAEHARHQKRLRIIGDVWDLEKKRAQDEFDEAERKAFSSSQTTTGTA